jgi:predicted glutamine amidotransferase
MCRVLAYLGEPVALNHLLFAPDNSLVRQSYAPRRLPMLNLAGFGLAAWDRRSLDPEVPFLYHTVELAAFDANLRALARKVRGTSVLAHVRGIEFDERSLVGPQYLHPFLYRGMQVALAHNGSLAGLAQMRAALRQRMRPDIGAMITTNLDSEWIYALFLSQLEDPAGDHSGGELADALVATLSALAEVRDECGIAISSSVNLFVANRHAIVGARYVFDFGCFPIANAAHSVWNPFEYLSLWYSVGRGYTFHEGEWKMIGGRRGASSVLIASEPLTRDESTWLELPEYSLMSFDIGGAQPSIQFRSLSI